MYREVLRRVFRCVNSVDASGARVVGINGLYCDIKSEAEDQSLDRVWRDAAP